MNSDNFKSWRRDAQVCEASILQMVEVALGQSVSVEAKGKNTQSNTQSARIHIYCRLLRQLLIHEQQTNMKANFLLLSATPFRGRHGRSFPPIPMSSSFPPTW